MTLPSPGGGAKLPEDVRADMEASLGADLSAVRIHEGPHAASIGALAYTQGTDIHFQPGQYDPRSQRGRELLGHELVHVVQQSQGRVQATAQCSGMALNNDQALEREADERGAAAARGERVAVGLEKDPGSGSTHHLDQLNATAGKSQSSQSAKSEPAGHQASLNRTLASPRTRVVQRVPSPSDCHTFRPGLSPVEPIYKNTYKGTASTTIQSGWCWGSFERRWQLYDADDTLLDESFYTMPDPTYTIPSRCVLEGKAGGSSKPWSVWLKVTKTMVPFGADDPDNFPHCHVTFPVYNTAANKEAEADDAAVVDSFGVAVPKGSSPARPANTKVAPDVALKLIDNYAKGQPPFKPELGKGGASWFVTEGAPYTGISANKNIDVAVELVSNEGHLRFDEASLNEIFNEQLRRTSAEAEAKFREYKGLGPKDPLNSKMRKGLARFKERFAESRMWDRVAEMVRSSSTKAGEVILKEGGKFSKTAGKFAVIADATKIRLKGGIGPLVETLNRSGVSAEPVVVQAAEKLANKQKWAGRVRGAFRYGGRILLVVAVTADLFKIYYAEDKLKAVITSAGGWAGAIGAGSAFAAWFAPADTAGPWAWAAHGVGTLIAGGVGYWVGSETTRYIYELVPAQ